MLDKLRRAFFLTAATLCVIYYIVCIAYAWIGVSWLWIWPALAVFCLVRWFMLKKGIHLPKVLARIYYICAIAALAVFVVTEAQIISVMETEPEPGLDVIVTLGAAVRNGQPTSPLLLRMEKTVEYLNKNPETKVICSGGQGANESMSEAECIAQYLIAAGIDESRITLEDHSTDTEQNIANSFALIPEGTRAGIVTSSFHLYRALLIARLQGYEACGIPATTLLPLGIHYTVREFFAVTQLRLQALQSAL